MTAHKHASAQLAVLSGTENAATSTRAESPRLPPILSPHSAKPMEGLGSGKSLVSTDSQRPRVNSTKALLQMASAKGA